MDLPRNSGLQETHEHELVQACLCLKEHQGRGSESLVKLELFSTPLSVTCQVHTCSRQEATVSTAFLMMLHSA